MLTAPMFQMVKNAGMNGKFWSKVKVDEQGNWGYNFKTKEFVHMFEAGIIDPFKVVRLALESATAIASSLVNVEVSIVAEAKEDE